MHLNASGATLRLKSDPFRLRMFAGLEIEFKQMGIYLIEWAGWHSVARNCDTYPTYWIPLHGNGAAHWRTLV